MDYRLLPVRAGDRERFAIHYSNDFDGVVCDESQRIRIFEERHHALDYAQTQSCTLGEDHEALDLDRLQAFCKKPGKLDCRFLYYCWNIFGDTCRSVDHDFLGYREDYFEIHEELFWGCGFQGTVPAFAELTGDELEDLCKILTDGVNVWLASLKERVA